MPLSPHLSEKLLRKLYYEDGLTQGEIAAMFGCSRPTITRRMQDCGLDTRASADYGRIDLPHDDLYDLYVLKNQSAEEIANHFECGKTTVLKNLKAGNIPVRKASPPRKAYARCVPPEAYRAWTSDLAYAVGLITSDGCLIKHKVSVVKLVSTNLEIIELFLGCLQADSSVSVHEQQGKGNRKMAYVVEFSDRFFRAFLESIGLMPQKSNILGSLVIPDEFFFDFLRGAWDGDGCWSVMRNGNGNERLSYAKLTSGSSTYLEWVQRKIRQLAGLQGHIYSTDLKFNGSHAVALGHHLYYAVDLPALSWKREIWRRFA